MLDKDYNKIADKLVDWIKVKVEVAGCDGVVIGMSGGIDSSVTAVLCKRAFPDSTLGLIMPCNSNSQDEKDAKLVAEKFVIDYQVVDLEDTYSVLLESLDVVDKKKLAVANIKPRLRMTTLYYYASKRKSLVVGTDNRSELRLGYFTKFGDGGIDLAPLGNLVKSEVREVAKVLDIPKKIITKPPSAGLWKGQRDEDELGISYEEVDRYILTGEAKNRVRKVVDRLESRNSHKLKMPSVPKF